MFDVIIIGGGFAGTLCAVFAAEKGLSAAVIERNPVLGKKILQTGNGRCNIGNVQMHARHFHGENPAFVNDALAQTPVEDVVKQWERWGLPLTALEDGRMYPHSFQAKTVQHTLHRLVENYGISVYDESYVKSIEENEGFTAVTFDNRKIHGKNLVLATGGSSMKQTGSDGSGFRLAKALGLTLTPQFPGICALTLEGDWFARMNGVKFPAWVTLEIDGETIRKDFGDLLFTSYGISGPPILQQSRHVNAARLANQSPRLFVDLIQDTWSDQALETYVLSQDMELEALLKTLLHEKVVPVFLQKEGLSPHAKLRGMNRKQRQQLLYTLRHWAWVPNGSKTFQESQVTCGGVDTTQIDPHTMEAKQKKGLYCIGEILDVDGDCGGYNLHWAYASAYVCAQALEGDLQC